MTALFRVCRNVAYRAWPYMLLCGLTLFIAKIWMVDPWGARWLQLNQQVTQLQQALTQKEEALEKACQQYTQSALEKERATTQKLIDSAVATALAAQAAQQPAPAQAVTSPSAPQACEWEKAWPLIEKKYQQSLPWADVVPAGQIPDSCKRTVGAPTQDHLIQACQEAEHVLDDPTQPVATSWWSNLIRVRRLDALGHNTADIVDLLKNRAWQDAITQLEAHPNKENPKVKALVQNLKERLSYEYAYVQLTTWKQQLCATSAPSS